MSDSCDGKLELWWQPPGCSDWYVATLTPKNPVHLSGVCLTGREIAAEMGVTLGTEHKLMNRALTKLRRGLTGAEPASRIKAALAKLGRNAVVIFDIVANKVTVSTAAAIKNYVAVRTVVGSPLLAVVPDSITNRAI